MSTRHDPTYTSWRAMIARCTRPSSDNYPFYGGRGIKVAKEWLTFANFLRDMGPRPPGKTIDRINNNGNYEPGNCQWATAKEQAQHRREAQSANAKKTHCPRGHPYEGENLAFSTRGTRLCRACARDRMRRGREERRA